MSIMPDVFQTVLALPESDRAELACQIILSLDPAPSSKSISSSESSLADIIKARAERVASGEFQAYTIEEAMIRVRTAMNRELSK